MRQFWMTLILTLAAGVGTAAAKDIKDKGQGQPNKKPSAAEKFKRLDRDADGFLTFYELQGLTSQPDFQVRAQKFLAAADKNHDGKVAPHEFKEQWDKSSHPPKKGNAKPDGKKDGAKKDAGRANDSPA